MPNNAVRVMLSPIISGSRQVQCIEDGAGRGIEVNVARRRMNVLHVHVAEGFGDEDVVAGIGHDGACAVQVDFEVVPGLADPAFTWP